MHIITENDIKDIAMMHINASINDKTMKPLSKYHFFIDKLRLFYRFDNKSIIIKKNADEQITGVLIYTYDEKKFNKFAGPAHFSFYLRISKVLLGYYGFDFMKFYKSARSSSGAGTKLYEKTSKIEVVAKIWVLIVAKECRKQGIASELLARCLADIKVRNIQRLQVTVKQDNIPAIKAYEKQKFTRIGTCEESSGASYIMELDLTQPSV